MDSLSVVSALKTDFSWGFLATMAAAAAPVIAITNTLGEMWRISRPWGAFIAAEVLTFYALCSTPDKPPTGAYFEAFFLGFVLFAFALGTNQSLVGIAQRSFQPTRNSPGGWWNSWF